MKRLHSVWPELRLINTTARIVTVFNGVTVFNALGD